MSNIQRPDISLSSHSWCTPLEPVVIVVSGVRKSRSIPRLSGIKQTSRWVVFPLMTACLDHQKNHNRSSALSKTLFASQECIQFVVQVCDITVLATHTVTASSVNPFDHVLSSECISNQHNLYKLTHLLGLSRHSFSYFSQKPVCS